MIWLELFCTIFLAALCLISIFRPIWLERDGKELTSLQRENLRKPAWSALAALAFMWFVKLSFFISFHFSH
jgi:hypothetical protein